MLELAEPGASVMAGQARRLIEFHGGNWDSLHAFETLHWDGEKFSGGTHAAIDTAYAARDYAMVMQRISFERLREEPENPPYAYALQIEAYVSAMPPSATAAELAAARADARAGKLHQRPEARECAEAWVADIHGNLWSARKFRDGDGSIEERFTPAGEQTPGPAVFTGPLLSVARATGLMAWGLEPAPEERELFDAPEEASGA